MHLLIRALKDSTQLRIVSGDICAQADLIRSIMLSRVVGTS